MKQQQVTYGQNIVLLHSVQFVLGMPSILIVHTVLKAGIILLFYNLNSSNAVTE